MLFRIATIETQDVGEKAEAIARRVTELKRVLSPESNAYVSPNRLMRTLERSTLFVAHEGDRFQREFVGMAWLATYFNLTYGKGIIENVVVDPAHRGMKLGQRLMEHIITFARGFGGVDRLELTSRPSRTEAHALYRKLGFRERETSVFELVLP